MIRLRKTLMYLIAVWSITVAEACLITNCPKGGKRSQIHPAVTGQLKECIRCGPGLLGRCLGPAVCCGPRLGCLVATPGIVTQCHGVTELSKSHAKPCITPSGLGVCATDGVCCNSESCRIDLTCEMEPFADICSTEDSLLKTDFNANDVF